MNQVEEYLAENPELIPKRVSILKKKTEWLAVEKNEVKSKMIEVLSQSNKDLGEKINIWCSKENELGDYDQLHSVKTLTREVDILNGNLRTEKSFLGDLEDQIQQIEFQILRKRQAARKQRGRSNYIQNEERCKESSRQKLHAISVQLSDEQTRNSALREQIRVLMTERKTFNKEFNRLLEKLEDGKKYMKKLDTSVQHALRQKENMQNKLSILHERETKQRKAQEEEMRDLQMRKENEATWTKFFVKKNKARKLLPSTQKDIVSKRNNNEKRLSACHTIYDHVLQLCDLNDSSPRRCLDVVNVIKSREEKNASLLNFAAKQYDELQALRDKVLEQEKTFGEKLSEQEQKVAHHEFQRDHLQALKNQMEERNLDSNDDIRTGLRLQEKLFVGIDRLVKITKADVSPLLLLLGENKKTSQFNYKLFLQAVESRIMRLLTVSGAKPKELHPLRTKTMERPKTCQSSREKSSYDIEKKVILTKPCFMCYPVKRESIPGCQVER